MKFNSYFVRLNHSEINFTGNLTISDQTRSANFIKIEKDLYIAYFKNQVELKFLDKIKFKNNNKEIVILLPLLSKYNKRKVRKILDIIIRIDMKEKKGEITNILFEFLEIENFLRVEKLLYFFYLDKKETINLLIEKELEKKIKIIDYNTLYITSYKNFKDCLLNLKSLLSHYYENRIKTIKLSELESKLKIPQLSIFFRYLLNSVSNNFSFKIVKDRLIFQELALTESEKIAIEKIELIVKKNRLNIFSIDNILKLSALSNREINNSLWYLTNTEKIVQLNEKYFIISEELKKIINRLKKYKRNQGEEIDIKSFKDLTSLTRKYTIPVLEYFDSQNITIRTEDKRKILLVV